MLFLDRCGSQRSRPLRFSMVYSRGQYICASSLRNAWMTQQIATSTIWTFANVIQLKSLSCPYLKITRALKNKRTLLLLSTSSWHTNIYEWSVKFVYLLLPAVSFYKEHAKCNKKVINQTAMLSIWNWKELSHVIYQNSVGTATKHEKTVYRK